MTGCRHEELRQISTLTTETIWSLGPGGFYVPEPLINDVLGEDTETFECVACGEPVDPVTAPSAA